MSFNEENYIEFEKRHRIFEKKAFEATKEDAKPGTFFVMMILDNFEDPNQAKEGDFLKLITPINMTLGGKDKRIPYHFASTMIQLGKLAEEDYDDLQFFYKSDILNDSTVLSELDLKEDVVCIVAKVIKRPESMEIGPLDLDSTGILVADSQETNAQLSVAQHQSLLNREEDSQSVVEETVFDDHIENTYDSDNDETSEQVSEPRPEQTALQRSSMPRTTTTTISSPSKSRSALQSLAPNSLDLQSNSVCGDSDPSNINHNHDSSEKENVLETIGISSLLHGKLTDSSYEQNFDKRRQSDSIDDTLEDVSTRRETVDINKAEEDSEVVPGESPIQHAFRKASMENLESAIQTGRDALLSIKESLQRAVATGKYQDMERDMTRYIKQIDRILTKTFAPPTIIGVVGDTGAGKSSVINALLEEEQLVPTSGMRACTAVVTEISYNRYSPQTPEPYRAEIEFVSFDDWAGELELLYGSLQEDSKRKTSGLSDEVEVAWAKLKAVYPSKFAKGESISKYNVDDFVEDATVKLLLGSVHTIKKQTAGEFYKAIKDYVDSISHKESGKTLEYWPLIKVVRLYVRSEVLKSGAVIVDLPGVHDQNAGRAAVADRYMRKCSGYWIVAPISRAVDSKTAKTILAEAFKRQVVMDGLVENTTFICSMTDSIVNSEIYKAIPELGKMLEKEESLVEELEGQQEEVDNDLNSLDTEIEEIGQEIDRLDEAIDEWENLRDRDSLSFPLSLKKRKRRRDSIFENNKRRRNSQEVAEGLEGTGSSDEYGPSNGSTRIKSREELNSHLDVLRDRKKEARARKSKLTAKKNALKSKKLDLRQQIQAQKNLITRECIKARNDWSREQLKKNFAIGLKEADDTAAEQADPENFDPDIEIRDYEACRRNFPVFCVSSRGYHRLKGRMGKESDNMPFNDPEQTELPALQSHCISVTERPRRAAAVDFGVSFEKLVNSLNIWISNDDERVDEGTMDERQSESVTVQNSLTEMKEGYRALAQKTILGLQSVFDQYLYKHFGVAIQYACSAAHATVDKWKATYKWNTFRATCKQKGNGNIQMNQDLAEPLINSLSTDWEKCFQSEVPQLLERNRHGMTKILKKHYHEISAGVKSFGLNQRQEHLLREQARMAEQRCGTVTSHINSLISERQRDISRKFAPEVQKIMEPAYAACAEVSGGGTYDRMKNILHDHLETNKNRMFTCCMKAVQEAMQEVGMNVLLELENIGTEIYDHFYDDLETLGILPMGTIEEIRPKKKKQQRPAVKTEIELVLAGLLGLLQATAEGAPDPSAAQIFQDLDKSLQSAIMGSQTLLNDDYPNASRLLESPEYIHHPYSKLLKASNAGQFEGSSQDGLSNGKESMVSSQLDFTINEVVDSEFDSSEEISQKVME